MTSPGSTARLRSAGPGLWLAVTWLLLLLGGYGSGLLVKDARPAWDMSGVTALRGDDHGTLTELMRNITNLGSPLVLNGVFVAGMAILLLRRHWHGALFLILASPATVVLVHILKSSVHRARPADLQLASAHGASWPSGHASSSLALYGGLLLLALSGSGWGNGARRLAIAVTAVLVMLIGLSRVYLAVHFPTDVAASWILVAAWLAVLTRTFGPGEGAGLTFRAARPSTGDV